MITTPRSRDSDGDINRLTGRIIAAAIDVHRDLGPGLLESAYQACLASELTHRGLQVAQQVPVRVVYRDVNLDCGYRIDMLVEQMVVLELKVVAALERVHTAQVLTYLRLTGLEVGLLFNFSMDALAAGGIKRVVRGHHIKKPSESSGPSGSPAAIR